MPKGTTSPIEMDFESGANTITLDGQIEVAKKFLYRIKNPYHGSKRQLVYHIFKELDKHKIEYSGVLDLFCGSSAFAITAMNLGKNVWANDLMRFCSYNAFTFLDNEQDKHLTEENIAYLLHNDNKNKKGLVLSHWNADASQIGENNHRFSKRECMFIDNFQANAVDLGMFKYRHAITAMIHYIMEHCFVGGRLNHGKVLADYDHRVQHNRNQGHEMSFNNIRFYNSMLNKREGSFICTSHDVFRFFDIYRFASFESELCYIDPPYGGQSSDYLNMYDFFERYATGREADLIDKEDSSKFAGVQDYYTYFKILLAAVADIPCLVFSYNDSSWAKIEDICTVIKEFRKIVTCSPIDYAYKYRKQSKSIEYVIIAK